MRAHPLNGVGACSASGPSATAGIDRKNGCNQAHPGAPSGTPDVAPAVLRLSPSFPDESVPNPHGLR